MGRSIPEPPRDFDRTAIIQRPDGFYWQSEATGEEYGPFLTRAEALADMQSGGAVEDLETEDTLEEADDDLPGRYLGRAAHQAPEVDGVTTVVSPGPLAAGDTVRAVVTGSEGVDLIADVKSR